ncbi:phage tail spike protein [Enterococcus gilvus]|uniref:phage tail spike protein n=1 Tax=Enterococcus gilvus TaxID=160453 RepID=UPI003ED97B79
MSTIILHDKKNNNWSSLGIGPLSDALNPLVSRERNGMYELTFKYPVKAPLFIELKVGRWVVADAGPSIQSQSQRFEIAEITKPINGVVTVYCEHYRYQLLRSIVKVGSAFSNIPAQTALNQLRDRMEPKGDFTFYSDILTRSSIDFTDPSRFGSAQEALGGTRGSVLDNFGGEYVFNNNQVRLMAQAGTEKNVIIAYGKNLTDINQEESIENTYTSVYGWAKVGNGNDEKIITLPETYIDSEYVGNYTQRRIQMVDFSDKEPKDVATLRTLMQAYIKNNKVGIPKVSIKTKYVDLASSVMDEQLKTLETIDLCDWVTVVFNELDINTSAQIVKTLWNVTLDKYESVELGEARTDFAKVLDNSQPDVDKIKDKVDWLEKAQQEASDIIKNPGKGHVVIYPSLADPQEILIMDTMDINTARKVWRWNAGGLGFSSTGYNGTYGLAMTNNGAIVADQMTTGTLRAINIIGVSITGSTISSSSGISEILLANGSLKNLWNGKLFSEMTGGSFELYKTNGSSVLGGLYRTTYLPTGREYLNISAYPGTDLWLGRVDSSSGSHIGSLKVNGNSGEVTLYNTEFGADISGNDKAIKNIWLTGLKVPNNAPVNFYSSLDMHGFSIYNQSDIRLKENIEDTRIDGIEETKKLNFVEFDRRQNYQSTDPNKQPNSKRELGLIAQYSPFLSVEGEEDNYQRIDMNKQIMLNSLTNKQLIEKVERLEKQINHSNRNKRKYHRGGI